MKKILITSDGLWPPNINNTGMVTIFDMIKELSQSHEVYLLTFIEKWTDSSYLDWKESIENNNINIRIIFINLTIKRFPKLFFYIQKIILPYFVRKYNLIYRFDSILEISSAPIMVRRTSLYKYFFNGKLYHYIAVVNNGFVGKPSFIGGKIDKVFCATKTLQNKLENINNKNKFVYLPTPVKMDKFVIEERLHKSNTNILYLGLIDERKGIDIYVKAIKYLVDNYQEKLINVKFNIVTRERGGNFYSFKEKKRFIFSYLKGYEQYFSFQEKTVDTNKLFQKTDLTIFPITNMHGILGYPLTILECVSSETMVFVSRLDEILEFVPDDLTFDKNDYKMLSAKILDFLDDKSKYKIVIKEIKNEIKENLDVKKIVSTLKREIK